MSSCEMCGRKIETPTIIIVEGAEMGVCDNCRHHGHEKRTFSAPKPIAGTVRKAKAPVVEQNQPEVVDEIVEDFSAKIRKAREKLGMTQSQFAKHIAEKESFVQKMEIGAVHPPIKTARKLESRLKLRLVERVELTRDMTHQSKSQEVTIGDLIKFK